MAAFSEEKGNNEYGLRRMVFGTNSFVPISFDEYVAIQHANAGLVECMYVEQKFDLAVENYLEFEKTLLASTADHMILSGQDYRWFHVNRGLLDRRIMNLLSTGRTYVDAVPHHVNLILGRDSEAAKGVPKIINKIYDARLGYRAIYALRNFIQHRGLPVHGSAYGDFWVEGEEDGRRRVSTIDPYIRPDELRTDGDFKAAVLKELEPMGKKIGLKSLIRDYMEGLRDIHSEIQAHVRAKIVEWEAVQDSAISRFQAEFPDEDSIIGLSAVVRDPDGCCNGDLPLFKDSVDYRKYLEAKNSGLQRLAVRYVSGEVRSHSNIG